MTQIIEAIAEQIVAGELQRCGFKIAIGGEKSDYVAVIRRKKRMEIKYIEGADDYTITKQKFKRFLGDPQWVKEEVLTSIYCDELQSQIEGFFKFEYVNKLRWGVKNG